MAFDPDAYLTSANQSPSVSVEPAPEVLPVATTNPAVSGFDPDAYLKSVAPPATAFDPDAYLKSSPISTTSPAEPQGFLGKAKQYVGEQADILGADLQIGAINTGISIDQMKLAALMELQETRLAQYGNNPEIMPPDVRKDFLETGNAINRNKLSIAESAAKAKDIELKTGVRASTKEFRNLPQNPIYQNEDFLGKSKLVGEAFIKDPIGIITDLGLTSLPQSLAVASTAVLARTGQLSATAAATAGGTASAMMEFGGEYSKLRDSGMNHKEAWEKAGVKSGVIGLFDGISFKTAGNAAGNVIRNIQQGAVKETAKTVAKETAIQGALGASGEALGSVATGQPIDPSEVAAEAIGEIFGAPGEAVGTYRAQPKPIGVSPSVVPATEPIAQSTAAPVEQAQRVPPASEFQDTAALMAELQGKPLEKVAMPVAEAVTPEVKPTTLENIERPQIQTPQFQQWFGNSQVKDEQGKPLVVYHGTNADIKKFGDEISYKQQKAFGLKNDGLFYFTSKPSVAGTYADTSETGANIVPSYLSLENPLIVDAKGKTYDAGSDNKFGGSSGITRDAVYKALDEGNDGVIVRNVQDEVGGKGEPSDIFIAFNRPQIKSAISNTGAYSRENPNISENIERLSTAPPVFKDIEERAPSFRVEMNRLKKMYKNDRIPPEIFANQAISVLDQTKAERVPVEKLKRGQNIILEKMNAAARKGELDQQAVDLATWFINRNPNIVEDLAISIKSPKEGTPSGSYLDFPRLMTLYKESGNSETAVHEILHHTERMMPEAVQMGIRKLWLRRLAKAAKQANKGTDTTLKTYFDNLLNYHLDGKSTSLEDAKNALKDGAVDYSNYQYINPSEFWAVNATDIVAGRFEGDKSFVGKLKQWIREFAQKAKSLFGLDSNAPIINALNSLAKSDGKFKSKQLIGGGENVESFAPSTKTKPRTIMGEEIPAEKQFTKLPKTTFQTKLDNVRYAIQDKYIDTKRIQQSILAAGRAIDEDQDAYLKQEVYSTRSATKLENYTKDHLTPLLKELHKNNISVPDFENYLHNRTAEERNKIIANRNPDDPTMQDGGSGIDTQDAKDYLKSLSPEKTKLFERLADKAYVMTKLTQDLLVETGMEPKEKVEGWVKSNPHYVPLFREETDYEGSHFGTGSGFSSRGNFSKPAVGSKRPVVDILSNIALQYERAVKTSEKARVGRALVGLGLLNPNPKFWMVINPSAITDPDAAVKGLESVGLSADEASNLIAEPEEKYTGTFLKKRFAEFEDAQKYANQIGGFIQEDKKDTDFPFKVMKQEVRTRINPANRFGPYVFPVRVNGKDWYIVFNQQDPDAKRMSESLKNMDAETVGLALQSIAKATRFFASINTQYNPVFGVINFARDFSGSMVNLSNTPIAGKQKQVAAKVIPALMDIYKDLRQERKTGTPATGEYAKLYEELKAIGGTVGFAEMFGKSETNANIIEREMKKLNRGSARKAADAAFNWLSDYNNAIENAMRVAVYKTALDNGISKERAASIAKNITVNFNRHGAKTQTYNALFAFFNAALQGSARLAQTLTKQAPDGSYKLSSAGKKIISGGILLGVMQAIALSAAGFGDDEPQEFVKQKSLIIPTGGKSYVSIPLPLGLHIFPNIGRITMEYTISGGKNGVKKLGQFMGSLMDAFNPLGGSGLQAQTFAPTFIDPVVAIMENRDAFGRPIAKEDRGTKPSPGYTRYRDTASEISKQISYFLNLASGGTKYTKGLVSPTPDQLDFLMGQLTGGVGREILKGEQAITSLATGEELPPYKIPLAGRFYGNLQSQSAVSGKFYENVTKLSEFEDEIKGKIKDKEDYRSVLEKHPEARLWQQANRLENEISKINKERKDLLEKNAAPARIKQLEERKTRIMNQFNNQVKSLEK